MCRHGGGLVVFGDNLNCRPLECVNVALTTDNILAIANIQRLTLDNHRLRQFWRPPVRIAA